MKKSYKLIQLLATFSKDEWKEIRKIAQSPFFTQNQDIEKLVVFLKKFSPDFSSEKLTKELIFKNIYPNDIFSDAKLRKLFSETSSIIRRYLVISNIESNAINSELELLDAYQKRALKNEFALLERKVEKKFSNDNFESPEYLSKKIRFDKIRKPLFDIKNFGQYHRLILTAKNDLQSYFEIQGAIFDAEITNNNQLKNTGKISVEKSSPVLKTIYQNIKRLRERFEINLFEQTVLLFETNFSHFSENRKHEIYQYFHNIIITAYNFNHGHLENAYKFYEKAVKNNHIYYQGFISGIHYTTIVSIGAKFRQYEWVEKFMEENEKKLAPKNKEQYILSANTNYFFERKMFIEALSYNDLRKIKGDSEIYLAKMNQVKINFELFLLEKIDYETLSNKIMLEKKWIKRKKNFKARNIKMFLNFHNIINKMLKYCSDVNKNADSYEMLKAKILKGQILSNKIWVNLKLREIENFKY